MAASVYDELNLDDIVQPWSHNTFKTAEDGDADSRYFQHIINYSMVKFNESEPQYQPTIPQGIPKSEIIYETVFRNDTDYKQDFSLKTIRATTSTAKININRGIVVNGKSKLNVSPLPEQISGKCGFQNGLAVDNVGQQEFKERLEWQIDTHVTVGSGSTVKAEVIVKETSYRAKFSLWTHITGNVHVDVVDPYKNNSLYRVHDSDIVRLIKHYNKKTRIDGLVFQNHAANFLSEGICTFKYGVKQNVNLTTLNDQS